MILVVPYSKAWWRLRGRRHPTIVLGKRARPQESFVSVPNFLKHNNVDPIRSTLGKDGSQALCGKDRDIDSGYLWLHGGRCGPNLFFTLGCIIGGNVSINVATKQRI